MNARIFAPLAAATSVLALHAATAGAVPDKLTLAARVVDDGTPAEGAHDFRVSLFSTETGGTSMWSEDLDAVEVSEGYARLVLGDTDPLDDTAFSGAARWFEIEVDGQRLSPRLEVTSVPYAQHAAVADTATTCDTLDGMDSTQFLPKSVALACSANQKVVGIDPATGSVQCATDIDTDTNTTYTAGAGLSLTGNAFAVAYAGTGTANNAARSDHNHTGVYLPLSATRTCGAGTFVSSIGADGSVACLADAGDITGVTASTGLTGGATTGTAALAVDFPVTGTFNGTSSQPARFDHVHHSECPSGYNTHYFGPARGILCVRRVAVANVSWNAGQRACAMTYQGGELCEYKDLMTARISGISSVPETMVANYWMGDRTGDNLALYVNGTGVEDFDGEADTSTTTMSGYYCCIHTLDERVAL